MKHLKHRLATCVFHPSSSVRRNASGMGRRRAAPSRPLLEESGGSARTGRRQALAGMQAAAVAGGRRGRRGHARDGAGHRQALARRGPGGRACPQVQAQVAAGELWPGRGGKKGLAGSSGRAGDKKNGQAAGVTTSGGGRRHEGCTGWRRCSE